MNCVFKVVFLTILCQYAMADLIEVAQCDGAVLPHKVDIANCTRQPCPLVRGADAVVQIGFFAPYYIENFFPEAKATALGTTINYPLSSQKNGCEHVENTLCPLDEGEYVSYKLVVPVLKIFPKVAVDIAFSLKDQDDKLINCFIVNTVVVDEI